MSKEMKTVYLVESGSYDDHGIDAAFSTKEKAELAVHTGLGEGIYWREILVDPPLEMPPDGFDRWTVEITAGEVTYCRKKENSRKIAAYHLWPSAMQIGSGNDRWFGDVWAVDEADAIQCACELIEAAKLTSPPEPSHTE